MNSSSYDDLPGLHLVFRLHSRLPSAVARCPEAFPRRANAYSLANGKCCESVRLSSRPRECSPAVISRALVFSPPPPSPLSRALWSIDCAISLSNVYECFEWGCDVEHVVSMEIRRWRDGRDQNNQIIKCREYRYAREASQRSSSHDRNIHTRMERREREREGDDNRMII